MEKAITINVLLHFPGAMTYSSLPTSSWKAEAAELANESKGKVFGWWQLLCGNKVALNPADRCRIAQSVVSARTRAPLLLVRIFKADAGGRSVAMITTPHSISRKPGIVIKVDDNDSRIYAFETCNEDGCHVGVPFETELADEFRKGGHAVFLFFDGAQNRVAVPLSLPGFTAASKVMR